MEYKVEIGDEDNKDYKKVENIEVDDITHLVLTYGLKEGISMDIYDKYFNYLINYVENQVKDLPKNWYFDSY